MTAAGALVGIDLGGTWARVVSGRLGGERTPSARRPAPASYDDLVEVVVELVTRVVAGTRVAAAVCSLPGTARDGRPVFVPALPFLEGAPLARDLAARLGAPVRLGFDGHLTLLAEAHEGAAAGKRSAVLVAVGTGIGGAIMIDRRIWEGHHGSAGAFGWLPAAAGAASRSHGGFEQVASGSALDRLAEARHPGARGADLVAAARRGEPEAAASFERYGRELGVGIAAIASILDPEVVVLGGGLSAAFDLLAPALAATIDDQASPDGRRIPVLPAGLGAEAGAIGALLAAGREEWLQC